MTKFDAKSKPLRFITGMHRSGTTWVGQVVAHALPGCMVHEPLNATAGLIGVEKWYYGPKEGAYIASIIGEMLGGQRSFRRRRRTDTLLRNLARSIAGSRNERELSNALQAHNPMVILKDPFVIRLGALLAKEFGAKGVVLMRHPAALVNSLKRMGWSLPPIDAQPIETYSADPDLQFAFHVGKFWSLLYGEVEKQLQVAPDHLHLFRHEDLCNEPVTIGARILGHLDVPSKDAALDFLRSSTSGQDGEVSGNQLHNMHRDAKKLAESEKLGVRS